MNEELANKLYGHCRCHDRSGDCDWCRVYYQTGVYMRKCEKCGTEWDAPVDDCPVCVGLAFGIGPNSADISSFNAMHEQNTTRSGQHDEIHKTPNVVETSNPNAAPLHTVRSGGMVRTSISIKSSERERKV